MKEIKQHLNSNLFFEKKHENPFLLVTKSDSYQLSRISYWNKRNMLWVIIKYVYFGGSIKSDRHFEIIIVLLV